MDAPWIFYGTAWKEERTLALVTAALAAGFRAIDTANQRRHYVEAAVGEAWVKSGIPRAQLFLQTKFTHADGQDHRIPFDPRASMTAQVEQSFASSLVNLRTDYVDSLVLHGPSLREGISAGDWEVWRAMAALQRAGKTRLLGASNVTPAQAEALCADAAPPAFIQNRCYARSDWDARTRAVCRAHGVAYQGFSLLTANQRELARAPVARLVARSGKTLPQVVFRFARAIGIIPLTGTSDPRHMAEDLAAADFALCDDDVATLTRIAD